MYTTTMTSITMTFRTTAKMMFQKMCPKLDLILTIMEAMWGVSLVCWPYVCVVSCFFYFTHIVN